MGQIRPGPTYPKTDLDWDKKALFKLTPACIHSAHMGGWG